MEERTLRFLIYLCCVLAILAIIYLFTGLFVVTNNQVSIPDFLSAISSIAATFAAFLSWASARQSTQAAENSNQIALIQPRLTMLKALTMINGMLLTKSTLPSTESFWLSVEERDQLQSYADIFYVDSYAFGESLQKKLESFYYSDISWYLCYQSINTSLYYEAGPENPFEYAHPTRTQYRLEAKQDRKRILDQTKDLMDKVKQVIHLH